MSLTINLNSRSWEIQLAMITQLEYWPVLVRWSNTTDRGFIFKLLFLVLRFGVNKK